MNKCEQNSLRVISYYKSETNPMKKIYNRFYMIFIIMTICILITGCSASKYTEEIDNGNSSNLTVNIENEEALENEKPSESEETSEGEASSENKESSENVGDMSEESAQVEAVLQLKPCATYQDILDNAYEVIIADNMTDIVPADKLFIYDGICEAKMGRDTSEALAGIGYTLYDVDGNGIEELIIADTGPEGWNNRILLMYTLHDDKPVLLLEGWARNRYYLLNDGTIYNEGSSGAAYTSFGIYRMAEDGRSLEIIEFENEDIPGNMMEDYMAQVKELELTFFEKLEENQ